MMHCISEFGQHIGPLCTDVLFFVSLSICLVMWRILQTSRPITTTTGLPRCLFVASIGNPGNGYARTRHSVGHIILKELISQENVTHHASTSYMNTSGPQLYRKYKTFADQSTDRSPVLVVLHDELDLKLGKVKLRLPTASKRHNGHNGIKSIQQTGIGKDYYSISIGIGRPESRDPKTVADYVLSNFTNAEMDILINEVAPQVQEILSGLR